MGYNFPSSPTVGQVANGYVWNGQAWVGNGNLAAVAPPSDGPPASPVNGQLWWETDSGDLYIWYNDGNSSQWVQISGPGLGDAPSDGKGYVRRNGVWSADGFVLHDETVSVAKATMDVNLLGLSHFEYRLWILHNPAAASGGFAVRNSVDGGATYRAGAGDYVYTIGYSDYPNPMQTGSATISLGAFTNGNMGTAPEVPILVHGVFYAGAAARRMELVANYGGYSTTDRAGISVVRAAAAGKSTHLRFMSDDSSLRFDVGTRLIVKGYP